MSNKILTNTLYYDLLIKVYLNKEGRITLKNFFVVVTALSGVLFVIFYVWNIFQRKIEPTLSTWIIFLFGTGLSLITYGISENRDFKSGILNVVDFTSVVIILLVIIIYGKKEIFFKPFEKYYLLGVAFIITYGLLFKDAWGSNIFTQVLIGIGYIPTIHNLLSTKKNEESIIAWIIADIVCITSLVPAYIGGNALSLTYSLRSVVLVSLMLFLMIYYELKNKKAVSY